MMFFYTFWSLGFTAIAVRQTHIWQDEFSGFACKHASEIATNYNFYRHDAILAWYMLWLCVCLSVTSRCSTKVAKHRIMQTKPHDSPGTLVC